MTTGLSRSRATAVLSLRDIQSILAEVERRQGLIAARRFVARLDYDVLTELARHGLEGERENVAAHVDSRYCLLLGMQGPEVADFQEALRSLGFAVAKTGTYDEATLAAYRGWLRNVGRVRRAP